MGSTDGNVSWTLDDLFWFVAGFRDARSLSLSGCVLLSWELLLTFDREVEYFWSRPFSWSKALFFSNRYGSLFFVGLHNIALHWRSPPAQFCSTIYGFSLYGTLITLTFAQVVLTVRVLALYQRYSVIKIVLYILFLATWGCSMGLAISVQIAMSPFTNPFVTQFMVGCVFKGIDLHTIYKLYIPFMVFQTILFVMTAYKGIHSFHGEQTSSIIKLLVRDGTMFYLVIILATGFTVAGTLMRSTEIPASLSNIILPAISLPTTRLMLNLRSSQGGAPSPTEMARKPLYRVNSPTHNRRAGHAMGMSSVYEVRSGVRVIEAGRTTFVEVEMDITESEDVRQHHTGVALWSTTGKWEDVTTSTPAFASQVQCGIEEPLWKDMESAPSLRTSDRIPSPRASRPYDVGIYEQPAAPPTTGTRTITYPRNPNNVTYVVSRTVSEDTVVSGGSTVVGSGAGLPTPGEGGGILAREEARTINWSLPTYHSRHGRRS